MSDYQPTYTGSHALVVGINTYSDPRFVTLGQAEPDAQAFGDLLAGPLFGFQVTRLIGAEANRSAILHALFTLRSAGRDDRILVYFAGHGYTLSDLKGSETGFLACADTTPEQDFTALKLDDVIDLTRHSQAKHICFIFDACFSGKALGLTRAAAVPSDKLIQRRAYQVLTAGAGDQTVADFESMTTRMIDVLRSGELAMDGLVTANQLGLFVQQAIVRESRHSQVPQFGHIVGSQGGDFIFHIDARPRLPGDLEDALRAPSVNVRMGAVADLIDLINSQAELGPLARERLAGIAQHDGNERVRMAAQKFFAEPPPPQQAVPAPAAQSQWLMAETPAPMAGDTLVPTPARRSKRPKQKGLFGLPIWAVAAGLVAAAAVCGVIFLVVSNLPGTGLGGLPGNGQTQTPSTSQPGPRASGDLLTFSSNRDGNWEIYVMNVDGSGLKRLTDHPASDNTPKWSPGQDAIAFAADRGGGNSQIYVMNVDGTNQKNLTNNQRINIEPAWSPDGKQIVYMSKNPQDESFKIYAMNADGSAQTAIAFGGGEPAWSPDGKTIAFSSLDIDSKLPSIFIMDIFGSSRALLSETGQTSATPAWSPDGQHIAFQRTSADLNADIFVMDANGGNEKPLTTDPAHDHSPAWSPDGSKIVFISQRAGVDHIFIMNADGSDQRDLTPGTFQYEGPAWLPD